MSYIKLSKEQELQLVEDYKNGMPVEQVKTKYGYATRKSVTDKIKKYYPNNYKEIIENNKKCKKGYDYSGEKINSEFDAYFIGLLMTDGYVTTRGTDIGIDLIDEDCIKFLSDAIGKKYQSYEYNTALSKGVKYRLILSLGKDVQNFKRYGIIQKKSLIINEPELYPEEEKFIPYIIRGIIDGDGSVTHTSYGAPMVSICSASKNFIIWIKTILEEKLYLRNVNINTNKNKDKVLYDIKIADQGNIQKIIALCYNKPFGMNRKFIKLRQMFRDYNNDIFS